MWYNNLWTKSFYWNKYQFWWSIDVSRSSFIWRLFFQNGITNIHLKVVCSDSHHISHHKWWYLRFLKDIIHRHEFCGLMLTYIETKMNISRYNFWDTRRILVMKCNKTFFLNGRYLSKPQIVNKKLTRVQSSKKCHKPFVAIENNLHVYNMAIDTEAHYAMHDTRQQIMQAWYIQVNYGVINL